MNKVAEWQMLTTEYFHIHSFFVVSNNVVGNRPHVIFFLSIIQFCNVSVDRETHQLFIWIMNILKIIILCLILKGKLFPSFIVGKFAIQIVFFKLFPCKYII